MCIYVCTHVCACVHMWGIWEISQVSWYITLPYSLETVSLVEPGGMLVTCLHSTRVWGITGLHSQAWLSALHTGLEFTGLHSHAQLSGCWEFELGSSSLCAPTLWAITPTPRVSFNGSLSEHLLCIEHSSRWVVSVYVWQASVHCVSFLKSNDCL